MPSQADGSSSEAAPSRRPQAAAEAFNGNAVKWALKKADESLDEIEENPPAVVEALYDISRGPVGAWKGGSATGEGWARAGVRATAGPPQGDVIWWGASCPRADAGHPSVSAASFQPSVH